MTTEAAEGPDQPALMAERRGQYPQGEAGEAASVTAVKEYAHEEPADVAGSFVLHEPPWYGTVCPVVWEDGGSNPASYPIINLEELPERTYSVPVGVLNSPLAAIIGAVAVRKNPIA